MTEHEPPREMGEQPATPERINPAIDPTDPLGMVNNCLYGYSHETPPFYTRSERQKIEDFLRNPKENFFTLQSGERISKEELQKRLTSYETSIYRAASFSKIFFVLETAIEHLKNEENRKHLELTFKEFKEDFVSARTRMEIEHAKALPNVIKQYSGQLPNAAARQQLEQALETYNTEYAGNITQENAGKAARTLLDVVDALKDEDEITTTLKTQAELAAYNPFPTESVEKLRTLLQLSRELLKKEGFS